MIQFRYIYHWLVIGCGLALLTSTQTLALTVTAWNLQWLSSRSVKTRSIPHRDQDDYSQLSAIFFHSNTDVLAFQEVNDLKAIKKVVGPNYRIVFSDRQTPSHTEYQFKDINQYTGFAIRRTLKYRNPPDLILSNRAKLRFASYIILYPEHQAPIHVLSVHLKTGCFTKDQPRKQACIILKQQAGELNHWLKQRESRGDSYMITGDFNHNLSYHNDWLWRILTKDLPQMPKLTTRHTTNQCQVANPRNRHKITRFRWLIDHTIVSDDLSFQASQQVTYPRHWITAYRLSDHCPLSTRLN